MAYVDDYRDEAWFEHQPNVAVRENGRKIRFYCADGSVHIVTMTLTDDEPFIEADGHFMWADQWVYDLFHELAIDGIAYWEGTNP